MEKIVCLVATIFTTWILSFERIFDVVDQQIFAIQAMDIQVVIICLKQKIISDIEKIFDNFNFRPQQPLLSNCKIKQQKWQRIDYHIVGCYYHARESPYQE